MANKYNERKPNIDDEQDARIPIRKNMLELLETERHQFHTDAMKGIRDCFAASLNKHEGDVSLAIKHLHFATANHLALDSKFLFKLTIGIIATAIYDELTDEQKEALRNDRP